MDEYESDEYKEQEQEWLDIMRITEDGLTLAVRALEMIEERCTGPEHRSIKLITEVAFERLLENEREFMDYLEKHVVTGEEGHRELQRERLKVEKACLPDNM